MLLYFMQIMTEDTSDLDNNRDYSQTSRFGSCNEFTIGMSPSPRPSPHPSISNRWYSGRYFRQGNDNIQNEDNNEQCSNHERKSSCD